VKLFDRLTAGVEVTPEGRELLPHARQVADASKKFREIARTMGDVQSRMVRIGSHLPMVNIPALRRLNDDFTRRYPNFSIRGTAGITPQLLLELNLGQLDVAAVLSPLPEAEDGEGYEQVLLGAVRPYLLIPRGSALAAMGAEDASLEGSQIAAPPASSQPGLFDAMLGSLRHNGATIRQVPEVDKRAMEHFARTHLTPVLMIEGNAADYADDETLTTIDVAEPFAGALNHLFDEESVADLIFDLRCATLEAECRHRDVPAIIHPADNIRNRHTRLVVKTLHEMRVVRRRHDLDRPQLDTRCGHVEDHPAYPLVLRQAWIGSDQ